MQDQRQILQMGPRDLRFKDQEYLMGPGDSHRRITGGGTTAIFLPVCNFRRSNRVSTQIAKNNRYRQ